MSPSQQTEHDLRALADMMITAGTVVTALAERLECLAAQHRLAIEAEPVALGQPHAHDAALYAYRAAVGRLRMAGVEPTGAGVSPCLGADRRW